MKILQPLYHDEKALLSLAAEMGLIDLSEAIQSNLPLESFQPIKPHQESMSKNHDTGFKLLT